MSYKPKQSIEDKEDLSEGFQVGPEQVQKQAQFIRVEDTNFAFIYLIWYFKSD